MPYKEPALQSRYVPDQDRKDYILGFRLNPVEEARLDAMASSQDISRSAVVRNSLALAWKGQQACPHCSIQQIVL